MMPAGVRSAQKRSPFTGALHTHPRSRKGSPFDSVLCTPPLHILRLPSTPGPLPRSGTQTRQTRGHRVLASLPRNTVMIEREREEGRDRETRREMERVRKRQRQIERQKETERER